MPASGNADSVNSTITITPGTVGYKNYYIQKFIPSVSGVYKFTLNGSGGNVYFQDGGNWAVGGAGGQTIGYLYLSANSSVYVGCGSYTAMAWVANFDVGDGKHTTRNGIYFVAGGGGQGGANWGQPYNMKAGTGGAGGGLEGGTGNWAGSGHPGSGGSASVSGSGTLAGGGGGYSNVDDTSFGAGTGGDGYYCGQGASGSDGGGGGSGYIYTPSLSYNGVTYTNSTTQGSGAAWNSYGSIQITLVALGEPTITAQPTITSIKAINHNRDIQVTRSDATVSNQGSYNIYYQFFIGPTSTYSDDYCVNGSTTESTITIPWTIILSKCGKEFRGTCYLYVRAYYDNGTTKGGWYAPSAYTFNYNPDPLHINYNGNTLYYLYYNGTLVQSAKFDNNELVNW